MKKLAAAAGALCLSLMVGSPALAVINVTESMDFGNNLNSPTSVGELMVGLNLSEAR